MRYAQNSQNFESTASYATCWSDIDWKKTQKYVDKQRFRIFRAEHESNNRKVRNLQRMLVRSSSALLIAIKRVTQTNKGKRTPGLDGFRVLNDKQRWELFIKMKSLNINLHKPKPANRIYIPKKNGKTRSLGIPTIIDRIYQELLRMVLEPQWECRFEPTSYGFRPGRRPHDAIERIFLNINKGNWCWVFEGDFKSCFDTLNHEFILKQINGFPYVNVVGKFLKAGYVDDDVFYQPKKGTPQGGLLSPLLANIALHGLEKELGIRYSKYVLKNGYVMYNSVGNYRMVRYADDFLIFAKTKDEIDEIPNIINRYLEDRGLILSEEKTSITHVSNGFNFLGFNCRLYNKNNRFKCLIKPSNESMAKARRKLSDAFKFMYGHNVGELISVVNPIIDGIANYWKPMVSKEAFSKLDFHVWNLTKKFLQHLHNDKSWKWIINKYFPSPKPGDKYRNKWILTDPKTGNQLHKMSRVKIKRHIMVKHDYSPLDKNKSDYFKNRELLLSN